MVMLLDVSTAGSYNNLYDFIEGYSERGGGQSGSGGNEYNLGGSGVASRAG